MEHTGNQEMHINHKLKTLLNSIVSFVNADTTVELTTFGVTSGKGGNVLLNCHFAAYSGEQNYYNVALTHFERILSELSPKSYKADFGNTYYQELTELGSLIIYLAKKGHLEWNCDKLLNQIDSILEDRLCKYILDKNLERVNGGLAIGKYFLERMPNSELARKSINKLTQAIIDLRQGDEEKGYYWICYSISEPRIYTGISHGIAMIISFLSDLHNEGIRPQECALMMKHGANYLLKARMDPVSNISSFPLWVGNETKTNNLCLVYGDLGTVYSLIKVAIILNDPICLEQAIQIGLLTTKRTNKYDTFLNDASILYGVSGTYLLYTALYRKTGIEAFAVSARYWLETIPSMASNDKGYLNFYPRFFGTYHAAKLGFNFGLIGIGLTLIQALSQDEHALDDFVWLN